MTKRRKTNNSIMRKNNSILKSLAELKWSL